MTTKKSFEDAYTKRYPVTVQFMPNKFDVNELGEYEDPAVIVGWSMWQAATAAMLELAPATAPEPLVPLTMEWEPGYPEDVAFGTQRQMDRLKKWLDKFFAMRLAVATAPAQPSWQDAPTCEGMWFCDEGDENPYRFTCHNVSIPLNPHLVGEGERWYGPIPEDKP